MQKNGFFALLFASFFFSLISVLNRFIPQHIGIFYQVGIKTFFLSGLFLGAGVFSKDLISIKKSDWLLLLLRGVFFIADFGSFFFAVNNLPLGTTLFLFYAGSIFSSYLYGGVVLKEKLTWVKIASVTAAFSGLGIIYFGNMSTSINIFILFAFFAGVCFGLETATSKKLTSSYSINQVNLLAYITATIISIPLLFFHKETIILVMPANVWVTFIAFSVVAFLAFYTTLYGFKYIEAQKGSIILLAELLFIIVIGYFLFKEIPNGNTLLGGLFILFALIVPNTRLGNN